MSDYTPINCSLYDELELLAIRKNPIDIILKSGETIHDIISTLETRKGEGEFLILNSGKEIRLDQLAIVDDKDFTAPSC